MDSSAARRREMLPHHVKARTKREGERERAERGFAEEG
jgi:hypothetical protein